MIKKAIIPAAGLGTRSLPITKVIPKEMFPINNKPSIQYVVEEAVSAGIEQILIIVSRTKEAIIDYFDQSLELEALLEKTNKTSLLEKVKIPDIKFYYIRQSQPKGLGHAISLGKEFVGNDPFAVLLPDDIIVGNGIKELIQCFDEKKKSVLGLIEVEEFERLASYGVIKGSLVEDNLYDLKDIVEKPQNNPPSNLAVIGRYVFKPEIMDILAQVSPDHRGEIQLTDGIKMMLGKDKFFGKKLTGERYDIGRKTDYVALQNKLLQNRI